MTRQVGNEIDEFVTGALRNNLLGLPLDLATINLARGRDTGVPSLNAARREFYEVTNNNSELRPYDSWVDFADGLKNPASIVNFIAAYGTHELITGADHPRGQARRRADHHHRPVGRRSTRSSSTSGGRRRLPQRHRRWATRGEPRRPRQRRPLDRRPGREEHAVRRHARLDLQLRLRSPDGEAAELRPLLLSAAPRRSAPVRRDGGQLLLGDDHAQHRRHPPAVGRVLDARPDPGGQPGRRQYNVSQRAHRRPTRSPIPTGGTPLNPLVDRTNNATPGPTPTTCATPAAITSCSAARTHRNDILIAGIGDDTIHGDGGNDRIEGGAGNDIINGGAGDDIITDLGGDDNIKGGDGNDAVNAGQGLNLVARRRRQRLHRRRSRRRFRSLRRNRRRLHPRQPDDRAHPRQRGQRLDREGDVRRRARRQLRRDLRQGRDRRTRRVPRRRQHGRVHRRGRRRHLRRQRRHQQARGHVRLRLGDLQGQPVRGHCRPAAQRLRRVPAAAAAVGAGPVRQRRGAVGHGLQRHALRVRRDRRRHAARKAMPAACSPRPESR